MSLKSRTPESSIDMIKAKAKRCLSKSRHLLVDACTAASDTSGRRHYTTVGYTNLKAHWHFIRCQCGNHDYSVNFLALRLLLTFALLNMRQPRFKLSLATGRGGRFPSHDLPHIYGMDSIILLRCSTVPGFTIWVWILSQRSAWGISITYSASAIWKSQAW